MNAALTFTAVFLFTAFVMPFGVMVLIEVRELRKLARANREGR